MTNNKMADTYLFSPTQIKFVDSDPNANSNWVRLVEYYYQQISQHPAQSWLLFHDDSYAFSVLLFALLRADKTIILPPSAQPKQIEQIHRFADAAIGCISVVSKIKPSIKSCIEYKQTPPDLPTTTTNNHPWLLNQASKLEFFTSGSTGQAKKISKSFAQLITEVNVLERQFGSQIKHSILCSTVSHQHIYGMLFKLLWPLCCGHKFVSQAFEFPEQICQFAKAFSADNISLIASPAHLHRIAADNVLIQIAAKLAVIFSSGGPLDSAKNIQLQTELSCRIIEVFGSTETGGIGWRSKQHKTDDIWTSFDDVSIQPARDDQLLAITSPYLADNQVYLTDDRVKHISINQFRLLGRADRIVKIEEKRVSLDEVQQKLTQHEYIEDAYVLVVGEHKKQLAAIIQLSAGGKTEFNQTKKFKQDRFFRQYLADWFEPVVLPKKFRYTERLPYNAQGKLIKKELELLFV
ncbi:AMP-binding protein [Catenovulum sp. 2E275]|uniref:AMP-binding protein n=1 Tax=Catenovulum sp. 2E275 TaxID=2980497 RepID=UPI0021CEA893|nr:AMP-binding protein [Catenovulum sp. 2E275]MCU4676659.1 AMP-binding protein [Catenovulum sp. 2E275]